ncbi:MAG: Hpt domain-containing protein [Kiloniellales bacterium]|nr:Hpt domain-containing protein [Kiloniellales bacterium]
MIAVPLSRRNQMLDLEHLSRQTFEDPALQRQVLELFVRQIDIQVTRLRVSTDLQSLRDAAHSILGSATAIGAGELAQAADRICASSLRSDADVAALEATADETRAFIIDYLTR